MIEKLFNEEALLERARAAIDAAGTGNAARLTGLPAPTISRIKRGKAGAGDTETYFRLIYWLTGKMPPQ